MFPFVRHSVRRLRRLRDRATYPAAKFDLYLAHVQGKKGIEIGGPSSSFSAGDVLPIYPSAGSIDNCDFSSQTVWAAHGEGFVFDPSRPSGRSFFCEGSQLTPIPAESYDFVLSSHNLEHFSNPLKALNEWKRVLRPGGALIMLLPYFRNTFDRWRTPTPVSHLLEDFHANIGEDDLTHLPEILEKHDLSRDIPAGTFEQFRERSLGNLQNRCLHHHVFDENNSRKMLTVAGFNVLACSTARPHHVCVLAQVEPA